MPEPTFGPDKCQEDKCLNPQVQAFVHRGICPLQAFVLRGICPTGGQMPVQAFVLPGICLSRHLSANQCSAADSKPTALYSMLLATMPAAKKLPEFRSEAICKTKPCKQYLGIHNPCIDDPEENVQCWLCSLRTHNATPEKYPPGSLRTLHHLASQAPGRKFTKLAPHCHHSCPGQSERL